jgi:site-specific recombinase XerC
MQFGSTVNKTNHKWFCSPFLTRSASWLVRSAMRLYQVGKLLGHSSTAVTEINSHLEPQDMNGILAPLRLDD